MCDKVIWRDGVRGRRRRRTYWPFFLSQPMPQCRRAASTRRRTIAGPAGRNARAGWITVIVMIALTASVRAQEVEIGRATYLENCAACHGADGSGGGAQGSRLKAKPTD